MAYTSDVDPLNEFEKIISDIKNADQIPMNELNMMGDDHPSLKVDTYTIGTRFFPSDPGGASWKDMHKRLLAKSFLDRTDIGLEILESKFKEWRTVAVQQDDISFADDRSNYEYHDNGHFVVDCFFIIEVIVRFTCGDTKDSPDRLSSTKILLKAQRDLIVNDNQLPFSVLEALFNLAFPNNAASDEYNFLKLCIEFFSKFMLITESSQASAIIEQRASGSEIKDFLDLLRKCHAPIFPRQHPTDRVKVTTMQKAHYLEEAGMEIRPSSIDTTSVCSLRYSKGLLEIPKLKISPNSRHLLRNLMEYENQHYPQDTFIIDYLYFMDSLIDTAKDVEILINNGILQNHLPDSKEVAALFNSITKEAPLLDHNYYYHGISESVNAYCQIRRHRWKATLRRDYCSSPWMIASTIAAIILLVLTFIQTVCSIISIIK